MKISVEREALLTQLQTAARVASARTAIQALSGVQVFVADHCELRATDMEIGLRIPVDAEMIRNGTVVLPARLLLDIIRSLPGPQVSLELRPAERDVELISGSAVFHIRTLRSEDFGVRNPALQLLEVDCLLVSHGQVRAHELLQKLRVQEGADRSALIEKWEGAGNAGCRPHPWQTGRDLRRNNRVVPPGNQPRT